MPNDSVLREYDNPEEPAIFYGTINQYFITDLNLGYKITNTYSILANITNVFNDMHREIIGGPELGRHFTFKVSATL